jgi:hypothetical protein
LTRRKKYRDLASDDLSAARKLGSLVRGADFDPSEPDQLELARSLRIDARIQYEDLDVADWPVFADFV